MVVVPDIAAGRLPRASQVRLGAVAMGEDVTDVARRALSYVCIASHAFDKGVELLLSARHLMVERLQQRLGT